MYIKNVYQKWISKFDIKNGYQKFLIKNFNNNNNNFIIFL